ncbi:MAG: VanZ family protein [Halorhodospira sp.]
MDSKNATHPLTPRAAAIGAWVSLFVVAYFTLLPFEFRSVSLEEAWRTYTSISFAVVGSDYPQWVANLLLYIPLGFFWAAWLSQQVRSSAGRIMAGVAATLIALVTTMVIEFLQIWLPYRYPAVADMSGNLLGGVVGGLAWFLLQDKLRGWLVILHTGGQSAVRLTFFAYAVAYIGLLLIPFDLVFFWGALWERMGSSAVNAWAEEGGCWSDISCLAMRIAEIVASVPLGMLLAWLIAERHRQWLRLGLLAAPLVGLALEWINLFVASGTVEGRSAFMRALGIGIGVLGAAALGERGGQNLIILRRWSMVIVVLGAVPYTLLLLYINHGLGPYRWDWLQAWETAQSVHWLPFYYHYHVAEVAALRSMLLHVLMYAPVGVAAWLVALRGRGACGSLVIGAGAAGAAIALVMEIGQLFVDGGRPDSAAILLAGGGAALTAFLLEWLAEVGTRPAQPSGAAALEGALAGGKPAACLSDEQESPQWQSREAVAAARRWRLRERLYRGGGGALALAIWLGAWLWPVWPGALATGLLVYALLLWRYPLAWLWVLPALVPALDWSLWTGWLHLGEVDLFIAMTLAITMARGRWPHRRGVLPPAVRWLFLLLVASTLISLGIALWPLPPWDPGLLSHYATGWNALRVGSGFLMASFLMLVVRAGPEKPREQLERGLVPGMAVAWLVSALILLRERFLYPGLLDFDSDYRISGWFSDMHVGGPSVEAFLVLTLPFAVIEGQRLGGRWLRVLGAALVALVGSYLVVVTYSRAGWLGLAVAGCLILVALFLIQSPRPSPAHGRLPLRRLSLAAVPFFIAGAASYPMITGGTAAERWFDVAQDLEGRIDHWQEVWQLTELGGSVALGRGVGAYPEYARYAAVEGAPPANFEFAAGENGGGVLRIGPGRSLFINQRLQVPREGTFRLELEVLNDAGGGLNVSICEKPVRHSFHCRWQRFDTEELLSEPQRLSRDLNLEGFGDSGVPGFRRGLVLALSHGGSEGILELGRVQLRGADGTTYVRNGDFEQAGRHWYFTTDYLWPYRTENQWLELYFDQGVFGLVAFTLFLLAVVIVLLHRVLLRDPIAAVCLAALLGVLTIGLFSTVFFNPKIALLFYLVALLGVSERGRTPRGRAARGTVTPRRIVAGHSAASFKPIASS